MAAEVESKIFSAEDVIKYPTGLIPDDRSILEELDHVEKIGEGTFGQVYKA